MTRRSEPNRNGASSEASSSASCSGVVSRMSGGSRRCRWRFEAGVSPVRVSMRIGKLHLGDRALEIARDVDRERFQRRDVERVQAAAAADAAAGGDEFALRCRCGERGALPSPHERSEWWGGVGGGGALLRTTPAALPHPSPPLRGGRGADRGAERPARCAAPLNSTSSAKIPPAFCRRRSVQSAAQSGRRAPSPASRADARAAPSRATQTSA